MASNNDVDVVSTFAGIAEVVGSYSTTTEARRIVVRLAQQALRSAGTAIWHLTDRDTMALDSCTDPALMAVLCGIVGKQPYGPAWQTMQDRLVTVVDDFATEQRWPRYVARLLAESPVRSAVVYPLDVGGHDLGVLAAYSPDASHFTAPVVDLGAVFAAFASLALENVALAQKAVDLDRAVRSHRRIGVAVGMLMARDNVTEPQAFDLLRIASQNSNTKLSEIADDVVRLGTLRRLA